MGMKDMIRATVVVDSIEEIWGAYDWLKKADYFRILTIKDKLDADIKNITLTFDFDEKMIGELQIRYGEFPPQYYANHYLYELERSQSYLEFMQCILKMAKTLAYRE